MIQSFWIIDQQGQLLYFKRYSGVSLDPELFSGFCNAFLRFAIEIGEGQIENISMMEMTSSFMSANKVLFVVSGENPFENEDLLSQIVQLFNDYYPPKKFPGGIGLDSTKIGISGFGKESDYLIQNHRFHNTEKWVSKRLILIRTDSMLPILTRGSPLRLELESKFGLDGIDVIVAIDGKTDLETIADNTNVPMMKVVKIIEYGITKELITKKPGSQDSQFSSLIQDILSGDVKINSALSKLKLLTDTPQNRAARIKQIRRLQKSYAAIEKTVHSLPPDFEKTSLETLLSHTQSTPIEDIQEKTSSRAKKSKNDPNSQNIDTNETDLGYEQEAIDLLSSAYTDLHRQLETGMINGLHNVAELEETIDPSTDDGIICTVCNNKVDEIETHDQEPASCGKCKANYHLSCVKKLKLFSLIIAHCPQCGHTGRYSLKTGNF